MKHSIIYLSFFLGAGVTVTFGFAYIGSPVTVPLGLLCLFTMWLIYWLAQEEPVTRLTEADMACDRCDGRGFLFDGVGVTRCPVCRGRGTLAPLPFQEPATGDPVGADPVAGESSSPAPDQSGGAAATAEPAGDTGAGETLFVGLGKCPACGEKNCYRVSMDGSGECSRCTYRRYKLPEGPARF